MIKGVHTMFYTSSAEECRAFIRDKLGFPFDDVGHGWLIFQLPEADMGFHPTGTDGPPSGTADISFYCDDIHATVAELKGRGVEFIGEAQDREYGYTIFFKMPGGYTVELYQPKYTKSR